MADNSNTLTLTLKINDDGSVTVDTVKSKIDQLNQSTASGGKSVIDVLGQVKAGWLAVAGGATAAYMATKEFLDAAAEAEQVESRMAFQLGQVGYKFDEIKPFVDEFADSILKTTRFSDEMARQGLGQMMQYTADVTQAMQGVKLAMDMSTQSGQDFGSTTRLVGMAMNGNAEILGRWIPELRDLEAKLGSTATNAEKAEYAIKILNEKFGGAAAKDIQTYAGDLAQIKNQYDELKESAGRALMPVAKLALQIAKGSIETPSLFSVGIPSFAEIGAQDEARRKANEQAKIASAAKAYADDLAIWKSNQDQRQAINFAMATQEWQLKKNTMALIDAEEYTATEKAKKYGADLSQIKTVYHLKRLEQIRKEKEEEQTAMLSLATLWKGYYDDRISKENEIIGLIKGTGVETTIGAKLEFAGVEEQFRKIAEKSPMLTKDELEKLKAAYVEKVKGILPFQGGEWEEIPVATGSQMGRMGPTTTWGTDYRWRESAMSEQQRQVEAMREESVRRIEAMSTTAEPGAAYGTTGGVTGIIGVFDETRNKALELQQTIDQVKNAKLQIDTSRLIDAMKDIDRVEGKLIDLIKGDYKIQVGVEIVGDELIQRIEERLSSRWINKQSGLRNTIEGS